MTESDGDWRNFYENLPAQAPPSAPRARKYGWMVATVAVVAVMAVVAWQVAGWWLRPPEYASAPPIVVVLEMPDRIGDRAKNLDDDMARAASGDVATIGAAPGIIEVQAAYYGTDEDKDLIYLVTIRSSNPSSAWVLDEMIEANFQTGGPQIVHTETVDPAPLGGWAKCVEYQEAGERSVLCAWADGGSRGMSVYFYTPLDKAMRQLPQIRAAVVRPV